MTLSFVQNYKDVRARLRPSPSPNVIVIKDRLHREAKRRMEAIQDEIRAKAMIAAREETARAKLIVREFRQVEIIPKILSDEKYSMREIIAAVCEARGVSYLDILSVHRDAELVRTRFEAAWCCRRLTSRSLPEIGRTMGGRDHTSILHAIRKHQKRIDAGEVDSIRDILPILRRRKGWRTEP